MPATVTAVTFSLWAFGLIVRIGAAAAGDLAEVRQGSRRNLYTSRHPTNKNPGTLAGALYAFAEQRGPGPRSTHTPRCGSSLNDSRMPSWANPETKGSPRIGVSLLGQYDEGYFANPSTMNESEFVDLMRAAFISF